MINKNVEKLDLEECMTTNVPKLPKSIFKYYSNITNLEHKNYSKLALKTNEVFLSNPNTFNDPFDSTISLNYSKCYVFFIKFYGNLLGINKKFHLEIFIELLQKLSNILLSSNIPFRNNSTEIEKMKLEIFILKIKTLILQNRTSFLAKYIFEVFNEDIEDLKNKLSNNFRISSLTIEKDNLLMWSHYANEHKGFCIEFDISKELEIYPYNSKYYRFLIHNLFPVIYSNERPELETYLFRRDTIFEWYKNGLLRKFSAWSYEKEWRLILLKNDCSKNGTVLFFPIKAVYCGCKMDNNEINELKKLIKGKNIDLYKGEMDQQFYKINFIKISN